VELSSLNVLIGPNGSGKSNLIEAISLLQACPVDLLKPIRETGGISDWLWKGAEAPSEAELDVCVSLPSKTGALRHRLSLGRVANRVEVIDEAIENERPNSPNDKDVYFYYRYQRGHPVLNVQSPGTRPPKKRQLQREDLQIDQSVLSQRKDPEQYPELTYLNTSYSKIRIFRDLEFSRNSRSRGPQPADTSRDFLAEDGKNLAMVLNRFDHLGKLETLNERLTDADGTISRISTAVEGNTVQFYLHYKNLRAAVPANRLSDGTVRYLALLSILLHPDPPLLVCIEEPEIGLHPDLLPEIAKLLIDASHRTQLVVTTHSDILVDALTEVPQSVLVCEKHQGPTTIGRKSAEELSSWLTEDYGLGQLWRKGELGGVRW